MGNLFSSNHTSLPFAYKRRCKRKQRASIASTNVATGQPYKENCIRVSVSCDANTLSSALTTTVISSQTSIATGTNIKRRRSSLKMTLKRAYSSVSASNIFTEERRQLVRDSWHEVMERIGTLPAALAIFNSLFRTCPELKGVFKVDAIDSDPSQISKHFLRHARVFISLLDLAIRNVHDLETEIGPILVIIGRRHFYKHQVDFRNEYLTLFAQSISHFVTSNLSESFAGNMEALTAWRLFISYIIHKIKEGYDLECIQRRKSPAAIVY